MVWSACRKICTDFSQNNVTAVRHQNEAHTVKHELGSAAPHITGTDVDGLSIFPDMWEKWRLGRVPHATPRSGGGTGRGPWTPVFNSTHSGFHFLLLKNTLHVHEKHVNTSTDTHSSTLTH